MSLKQKTTKLLKVTSSMIWLNHYPQLNQKSASSCHFIRFKIINPAWSICPFNFIWNGVNILIFGMKKGSFRQLLSLCTIWSKKAQICHFVFFSRLTLDTSASDNDCYRYQVFRPSLIFTLDSLYLSNHIWSLKNFPVKNRFLYEIFW